MSGRSRGTGGLRGLLFPEPWMRWYDLPGLRRLARIRWSLWLKAWYPKPKRLARLRCLYWTQMRGEDAEICGRCGHPVGLVYIAPDEIWEAATGYQVPDSGESAVGCLCPYCLTELAREAGLPFLRWTCSTDDSPYDAWVASHPARTLPERAEPLSVAAVASPPPALSARSENARLDAANDR